MANLVKQIIKETVARPKSPDEQRFMDQHTKDVKDYPVKQDKKETPAKKKRPADNDQESSEKSYDQAYAEETESEGESLEEEMKTCPECGEEYDDSEEHECEDDDDEDEDMKEEMTAAQMKKREEIVMSMKKKMSSFKDKYGDKAKDVMYATATKMAMKEEIDLDESKSNEEKIADLESMLKRMSGNTSSMKMKKYAIQKKIDALKANIKESVDINEDVIADLKNIVKTKSAKDVKFADGSKTKVDMFTASAMVKVHDALNAANQKKFADAINKDEAMFMKMMDFAFSKVK